jgi:LPXTG-motif cell wall-anchored protein
MLTKFIIPAALAALTLGTATPTVAQTADYQTYFTFSGPVTLPGVTLPAGKYLFRLADPSTSRKVINVLTADGKKSVAMLTSIPNRLNKAPNDPEVRFMETSDNTPPPIKTWWYPGNSTGYEFIYPRKQALQLAKVVKEPVLTTKSDTSEYKSADLSRVGAGGEPAAGAVNENPEAAEATGRAQRGEVPETRTAQADTPAPAPAAPARTYPAPERQVARAELPRTASSVPLVTLLGGLALVGGIGLLLRRSAA